MGNSRASMRETGNKYGSHAIFFINLLDWSLKAELNTMSMYPKTLKGTMRGVLVMLLTVLVACSEQQELLSGDGEEIVTSVSVKVPDTFKSRSVAGYPADATSYLGESGYPSIGNVDLLTYPLTFTVGVYVEKTVDGNTVYTLVDRQCKKNVSDDEADFNFRLMKDQSYRIVAYADFSGNEQVNLDNISITPGLNDELKDAFFTTQTFVASDNMSVVLKRPFGKLRLIARDFSTFAKGDLLKIENVKVTYGETATALATNSFNAITGKFNEITAGVVREFTAAPVIYPKEHEVDPVPYAAVFTMYLPVNFGIEDTSGTYLPVETGNPVPQSWMHPFNIELTYKNEGGETFTIKRSFDIDVPIKRNWLTTIDSEDFWTDNSQITVTIDHRFEGFINIEPGTHVVNNWTELRKAFNDIHTASVKEAKIELGSDIDATYTGGLMLGLFYVPKNDGTSGETLGNDGEIMDGVKMHLDLNGHKIFTRDIGGNNGLINKYAGSLFAIYGDNTLIIDDSSEEGTGTIEYCSPTLPMIRTHLYGGNVVINAGRFLVSGDEPIIYLSDKAEMMEAGKKPSSLIINSGWFENLNPASAVSLQCLINLDNGHASAGDPHPESIGYGYVYMYGGSFVGLNPANGDNISGNKTNQWVDDNHTVLKETVNGKDVYTVIPREPQEEH